jgi:menaquinone-dependent protoporphyrinogen oxidase
MRAVIIFSSRNGQTRRICERMAAAVRLYGLETHLFELSEVRDDIVLHAADAVVLAGPVYFDRHPKALLRFATTHRTSLAKVRTFFVSVSGAARSPEGKGAAAEYARKFLGLSGWAPDQVECVAGGEPYTKYGWFTRWFMVRHHRKMGRTVDPSRDYEFTDWQQVDRIARDIAAAVGVSSVPHGPGTRVTA